MEYLVQRDGTHVGIFDIEQLSDGLADGSLLPTDLAWAEEMDDFVTVGEVVAKYLQAKEDANPLVLSA